MEEDDLGSVSKLEETQRYNDLIQKVEEDYSTISLDDDHLRQVVALSMDIENEIILVHNFIRDNYRFRFPELKSLVQHPIDYAHVVNKIGNQVDLSLIHLEGVLPSALIMVVSVTASTTRGQPLSEETLHKTMNACDRVLAFDSTKTMIINFIETRMSYIAPNLSYIVGPAVAAKLMLSAGSLVSLANMPACNLQLLGARRHQNLRVGYYMEQTEVFQSTPPPLKMRACRLIAAKSTLAARVDSTGKDPIGKTGRALKDEILKKIHKWQEPPPARQPKPLPLPHSEPQRMKHGLRFGKRKERYAPTTMRKLASMMQFGVPEESSLGDGLGEGYGMLGQAGSGCLRLSAAQSRLGAKVAKKFQGRSAATFGLTSSLAFTPVQGIELSNPQSHFNQLDTTTQSTYFSQTGTFSKINKNV